MYFVLLNIKYHISPSLSRKTAQKGSLETHTNSKQNGKEYAGPHRSDSNFLYFCVHLLGVRIAVVFSGAKKSRHHKDVWIFVLSEGCDITYRCHACAWNCRAIEPNGFGPTYESPKKKPSGWMVSFLCFQNTMDHWTMGLFQLYYPQERPNNSCPPFANFNTAALLRSADVFSL